MNTGADRLLETTLSLYLSLLESILISKMRL